MKANFRENRKNKNPFVVQEGRFSHFSLENSHYELGWAEASFLAGTEEKEMLRRTFDLGKIKYIFLTLILGALVLISRIFWLQIVKGESYYSLAEGNRLKSEYLEAKRGIIYDANMLSLVKNEVNFVLSIIPAELPKKENDRDQLLRDLADVLEKQKKETGFILAENPLFSEIKEKIEKINLYSLEAYQPVLIKEDLDYQASLVIKLRSSDFPGIYVGNKMRRRYLPSESALDIKNLLSLSHVLGYTGKISPLELEKNRKDYSVLDYIGKAGLEAYYEKDLKGQKGIIKIEVDALGREKKISSQTPAQDGFNLQLSLSASLQACAEESLKKHYTVGRASVVAIDPRQGQILALVSYPAYDNNLFSQGVSQEEYQKLINNPNRPLFNRAISGEFPPGSTFKPLVALGALQEGIIDKNTSFLSTGALFVGQWVFPDWKAGGHGTTNVYKAIAESVNTFFYYIGGGYGDFSGLGAEKIKKYAELFGLGRPSGIDLFGESSGLVPNAEWRRKAKNETWYIGNTYHFSIGQGDLTVSPLQVANYTAAIANGGTLYSPKIVKKIFSDSGVIKEIEPEIINSNFISADNIEIIRQAMRKTVTEGSGRYLNDLPFTVAGKTGTAQWSSQKANHAWFTGFAPFEDPEISLSVLVEEGVEGSTVAVPIAKEIFSCYFSQKTP